MQSSKNCGNSQVRFCVTKQKLNAPPKAGQNLSNIPQFIKEHEFCIKYLNDNDRNQKYARVYVLALSAPQTYFFPCAFL